MGQNARRKVSLPVLVQWLSVGEGYQINLTKKEVIEVDYRQLRTKGHFTDLSNHVKSRASCREQPSHCLAN